MRMFYRFKQIRPKSITSHTLQNNTINMSLNPLV